MDVREDIRESGWLSPEDGGEGEGQGGGGKQDSSN